MAKGVQGHHLCVPFDFATNLKQLFKKDFFKKKMKPLNNLK